MAFLSAHIPSEDDVSTHTPVYILPLADSIAAATPPAEILSEMLLGFCTAFAA